MQCNARAENDVAQSPINPQQLNSTPCERTCLAPRASSRAPSLWRRDYSGSLMSKWRQGGAEWTDAELSDRAVFQGRSEECVGHNRELLPSLKAATCKGPHRNMPKTYALVPDLPIVVLKGHPVAPPTIFTSLPAASAFHSNSFASRVPWSTGLHDQRSTKCGV